MGKYNLIAYLAIQFKEITEHKYYLSEKFNKDISLDETINDWVKYHAKRFHDTFFLHLDKINQVCEKRCNKQCKGLENCILTNKEVHELLED